MNDTYRSTLSIGHVHCMVPKTSLPQFERNLVVEKEGVAVTEVKAANTRGRSVRLVDRSRSTPSLLGLWNEKQPSESIFEPVKQRNADSMID